MASEYINVFKNNPTENELDGTFVSMNARFTSPIKFLLRENVKTQTEKLAIRTESGYATAGTTTIQSDNPYLKLSWTENGTFTESISTSALITTTNKIFYARLSNRIPINVTQIFSDNLVDFVPTEIFANDIVEPLSVEDIEIIFGDDPTEIYGEELQSDLKTKFVVKAKADKLEEWRYYNAGIADLLSISGTTLANLPETKSTTGTAFYQTAQEKCFDIPALSEVWIKFDVFFNGVIDVTHIFSDNIVDFVPDEIFLDNDAETLSAEDIAIIFGEATKINRWRAFNGGSNGVSGITAQINNGLSFFASGINVSPSILDDVAFIFADNVVDFVPTEIFTDDEVEPLSVEDIEIIFGDVDINVEASLPNVCTPNRLQTFLLHMISGKSKGVVEAWTNDTLIYKYAGDVNHGQAFADIYLQSDGEGTFFSDVTISAKRDSEIFHDVELAVDVWCQLAKMINVYPLDLSDFWQPAQTFRLRKQAVKSISRSTPDVSILPEIIPSAENNTTGIQSIDLTLAEQQITDQVTFTGIIPFDVDDFVNGQYFDYEYSMSIESVTKSGILFTCHCCSDADELLYTLLNYKIPEVDDKYKVWHDANTALDKTNTTKTYDSEGNDSEGASATAASEHLWDIGRGLSLRLTARFTDFLSTVDSTVAGVTYRDLIRSIFGWTARIPPLMINVFIRGDQLYVIQRGHEEHVIDISNAKITQPVFTRELVRTFWGETPYINTEVRTVPTYTTTPVYEGIDKAKVQPLASDTRQDSDGTTTINYSYDADGMLIKTEEISPTSRTVTTHKYSTGANGNKFLVTEETTVYDLDGKQIDYRSVKHSPTNYGQAAVTAGNAQSENIVSTVKNVPYDERPTPYAVGQQLKALITEQSGSKRQERLVPGIVDFDTSFPIADEATLHQITLALQFLNRTEKETVTLSLYDYPHIIGFNDRIVLNDREYFLVSNRIYTTPRIFNQQNLTLVRWLGWQEHWAYVGGDISVQNEYHVRMFPDRWG